MTDALFFTSFEPTDAPQLLPDPSGPEASDSQLSAWVGSGPTRTVAAAADVGFSGLHALAYSATGRPDIVLRRPLFEVDLTVDADTELSYVVFPEADTAPLNTERFSWASTYVALDLEFADGSLLSELDATDQHGNPLTACDQGAARTMWVDQWNHRSIRLGPMAAGRRVVRVDLVCAARTTAPISGWLDDVRLGEVEVSEYTRLRPADRVVTTRGTHASWEFSRGNNIPVTGVPHGFNFWTPVTNASTIRWLYEYHRGGNAANVPTLQAVAISHQPSPWIGDRHTFQLLPSLEDGAPTDDRAARALPFRHANEVARPHLYQVSCDNGVQIEIAPTDHAAVLRFTFPDERARIYLDNVANEGGLVVDADSQIVRAHTDVRSDRSDGARQMFVHAELDRRIRDSGGVSDSDRPHVAGWIDLEPPPSSTPNVVTVRIATSLISATQAAHNLGLEVPPEAPLEDVSAAAARQWDELLGLVEVDGASPDQLTTLYSNLYRLFCYPNAAHENAGSTTAPSYVHASTVVAEESASTDIRPETEATPPATDDGSATDAPVLPGRAYVNNGFWDTYRTTWPAYALFTPDRAAQMVQGFVEQYQEGGWISRWSAPGYADCMVGTSSDVAFTDAFVKGVEEFDVETAYEAAVKNATVVPPHGRVGRNGLARSVFLGYTPTTTEEGLSWSLEGCVNDFGIAQLASALADRYPSKGPRHARLLDEAAYFSNRAMNYVLLFDERIGFFQGRDEAGRWRRTPDQHDPRDWGGDYTETNAWNMAFTVPHDGHGLANLYGGRDALARKLDEFFTTPESGTRFGDYDHLIHEMTEARDCLLGQYAHSNQPAHHIAYMYVHAGQPWKTQDLVRDVLDRLYVGSEIGQGYCGDEDNGEMSAWYVFSALGFYPLTVGAPEYVVGAPLFPHARVHLPGGDLVINAPEVSAVNRFVQQVWVNGQPWDSPALPHTLLAAGARVDFEMGAAPSAWGTGPATTPPVSLTTDDKPPRPLIDLTAPDAASASDGTDVAALFDDDATTDVRLDPAAHLACEVRTTERAVRRYTLTSGTAPASLSDWVLEGSAEGTRWMELDRRTREEFRWPWQTRPFSVTAAAPYRWYRLRPLGTAPASLAQIELLG